MALRLQELQQREAITNQDGTPSQYFLRYLKSRGGALTDLEAELVNKADKATQVIAGTGLDGGGDLSADITLDVNMQELLNTISSTQGSILYRGSTSWVALAAGTAGQVLTTNGAGANPSWETPSGGGGGSTPWTLIYSNTSITNPTANIDVDVSGYTDVLVLGRTVTTASSAVRGVIVSVNGGSSYYGVNGDYVFLANTGAETTTYIGLNHETATTAARSFGGVIYGINETGLKYMQGLVQNAVHRYFVASTSPINRIRICAMSASTTFQNMTGGSVYVYAR